VREREGGRSLLLLAAQTFLLDRSRERSERVVCRTCAWFPDDAVAAASIISRAMTGVASGTIWSALEHETRGEDDHDQRGEAPLLQKNAGTSG
jgi:hypothetical protein